MRDICKLVERKQCHALRIVTEMEFVELKAIARHLPKVSSVGRYMTVITGNDSKN